MKRTVSQVLQNWFESHKRELPWRGTNDAYKIWLSEIILQQTRVNQGLPYYDKFVRQFPTVYKFAEASEEEILKNWQGLGYYSRGRNMLKCAQKVVESFNGVFPNTYRDIKSLPGIGDYTASAILSFAYNLPFAVLDGNVYRFLSRYYGIDTAINSNEGPKTFKPLADSILDKQNPANHNQAIMEFGALHCKPKNPACLSCPFNEECVGFRTEKVDQLPVKKASKPRTIRHFNYLVVHNSDSTFIQKREGRGIWQNLYEFPLIETEEVVNKAQLISDVERMFNVRNVRVSNAFEARHILSHQEINAIFWVVEDSSFGFSGNSNIFEVGFNDLENQYAVPILMAKFLERIKPKN